MRVPVRVQRKRVKGWRLPPNTVCVTRPGKWGNPFILMCRYLRYEIFATHQINDDGEGDLVASLPSKKLASWQAVQLFRAELLDGKLNFSITDVRRELRGKNLACWCPIDNPCHADVLLAIANSEAGES